MSRDSYGATERLYMWNALTKTRRALVMEASCFRFDVQDSHRFRRSLTVAISFPLHTALDEIHEARKRIETHDPWGVGNEVR